MLVFTVTAFYCALILVITFFGSSSLSAWSRPARHAPQTLSPPHLADLAGFGLLFGGTCALVYGRKGVWFVLLIPVLVVLLDLDLLPVYLGIGETIRPAHSFVFLL